MVRKLWEAALMIGTVTGFLLFTAVCWWGMVTLLPMHDATVMAGTIGNVVASDGPLRSADPTAINDKFNRTLETMSGLTMVQQVVVTCPVGSNPTVSFPLPFKDTANYNVVWARISGTVGGGTWPTDYYFEKTSGLGGTFHHPATTDNITLAIIAAGVRK